MRPQKLRFDFLIAIFICPIRWDRSRGRFIAIFKDSGVPRLRRWSPRASTPRPIITVPVPNKRTGPIIKAYRAIAKKNRPIIVLLPFGKDHAVCLWYLSSVSGISTNSQHCTFLVNSTLHIFTTEAYSRSYVSTYTRTDIGLYIDILNQASCCDESMQRAVICEGSVMMRILKTKNNKLPWPPQRSTTL